MKAYHAGHYKSPLMVGLRHILPASILSQALHCRCPSDWSPTIVHFLDHMDDHTVNLDKCAADNALQCKALSSRPCAFGSPTV